MDDFWTFLKDTGSAYIKSDLDNKATSRQIAVINATRDSQGAPAPVQSAPVPAERIAGSAWLGIERKWWIIGGAAVGLGALALLTRRQSA